MSKIRNPIIPGFYPDPSICRVGEDYYIVNSSFELYPGIPLWHSRDLIHWEQICNVMTFENDFRVEKTYGGGGVMAPTIRYYNGTFYIICCNYGDRGNFMVTANAPEGPWSKPIYLQDIPGIDASIFFDNDGKCYVTGTNSRWNEELGILVSAIWAAEYDIKNYRLLSDPVFIYEGAMRNAEHPEAPHIYHINDYYYLLIAEGGTDNHHSVCAARCKSVLGHYENDPDNPVLTSRNQGSFAKIANVGHADLVKTANGKWYAVFLASRNIDGIYKPLGRETYICPVEWENDWPYFTPESGRVEFEYEGAGLPEELYPQDASYDDFDEKDLSMKWVLWGTPYKKFYRIRDSKLVIDCIHQDLIEELKPVAFERPDTPAMDMFAPFIARRPGALCFEASCEMQFEPFGAQRAGMALVQQMNHQLHFEKITENGTDYIQAVLYTADLTSRPYLPGFQSKTSRTILAKVLYNRKNVVLKIVCEGKNITLFYGPSKETLTELTKADMTVLCTQQLGAMVGILVGMFATGHNEDANNQAVFEWFEMK